MPGLVDLSFRLTDSLLKPVLLHWKQLQPAGFLQWRISFAQIRWCHQKGCCFFQPVHLHLYGVAADFAWIRGAPDEVVRYLDRALDIAPRVDRQLFKLRALMAGGHIDAAAVLLTAIENDIVSRPRDRLMYATDLQEIKDRLQVIRNSQQ